MTKETKIGIMVAILMMIVSLLLWSDTSFHFLGLSIVVIGISMFKHINR